MCHQLNNYSRGLQYYGGIEKYDNRYENFKLNNTKVTNELLKIIFSITEGKSWADASNDLVKKSQMIRMQSRQLQNDIDTVINKVSQEIWKAWNQTNNALAERVAEILPAKNKLLSHLQHVIN